MKNLCLVFLLVAATGSTASAQSPHPNIIVMMADDMGMGDTSTYQDFTGNSDEDQFHTPNMKRLARMGVRLPIQLRAALPPAFPSRRSLKVAPRMTALLGLLD